MPAASFEVGWFVGDFINGKLLKFGVPEAVGSAEENLSNPEFRWSNDELPLPPSDPPAVWGAAVLPAQTFHFSFHWNDSIDPRYEWRRYSEEMCDFGGMEAPPLARVVTAPAYCNGPWGQYVGIQYGAYVREEDFPGFPIEDYTGQPYTYRTPFWQGPASVQELEDLAADELGSGRYPRLEKFYEYRLGVPDVCDPVEINVCNPPSDTEPDNARRCEPSAPEGDPTPWRTTRQWDPTLYEVRTPFTRQTPGGGTVGTALKYGWTRPIDTRKQWLGWGWRHVAAKHGWTAPDVAATQTALLTPPRDRDGRLTYIGPDYQLNGTICVRVVVVARQRIRKVEPSPKEIITSYGRPKVGTP